MFLKHIEADSFKADSSNMNSIFYSLVVMGLAYVMPYSNAVSALPLSILLASLISLSEIDHKTHYIPDTFQLIGLLSVLSYIVCELWIHPILLSDFLTSLIINIAQITIILSFGFIYEKYKGRGAMGLGDVKLLFSLGVLVEGQAFAILLVAGLLFGLAQLFLHKNLSKKSSNVFAFGPYISLSFLSLFLLQG